MRSQGLVGGDPLCGITLVDSTFLKAEWPAHIISLCHGDYELCAHAMVEEPEPLYRYNACLQISDIEGFARALWEEGCTASGTPLQELFKEPLVGPMIYGEREAWIIEQTPLQSGYFSKRSVYNKQSEFRIVFPHVKKWAIRDRLVFNLPCPERFLSLCADSRPLEGSGRASASDADRALRCAGAVEGGGEAGWKRKGPSMRLPLPAVSDKAANALVPFKRC